MCKRGFIYLMAPIKASAFLFLFGRAAAAAQNTYGRRDGTRPVPTIVHATNCRRAVGLSAAMAGKPAISAAIPHACSSDPSPVSRRTSCFLVSTFSHAAEKTLHMALGKLTEKDCNWKIQNVTAASSYKETIKVTHFFSPFFQPYLKCHIYRLSLSSRYCRGVMSVFFLKNLQKEDAEEKFNWSAISPTGRSLYIRSSLACWMMRR